MWRPTRSILTFGRLRRKRTSGGKPLRMLIATRKPASQSFGVDLADLHFLLSCVATTRLSGLLGAVSVETLGRVQEQEATAIVGFVSRTHRGSETFQGNAAISLMAIHVSLSWVRFTIFNFFSSAVRFDFARALAVTSPRTRGIERTARSRMRDRTMKFYPPTPSHSHCPLPTDNRPLPTLFR
jgi:hypothetical protein